MKTFFISISLVIVFLGCYKSPDTAQLSSDFIVITNYDNTADFKSYQTFVMPPYVSLISGTSGDSVLDPQYGDPILQSIKSNLEKRGYTALPNDHQADIGVAVVALKEVTVVSGWYPGGWWGYPGWGGCYWYYCGYYPIYPPYYNYTYVYKTGSVIIELVDLKNIPQDDHKLKVLWTNWNGGALGSASTDIQNALNSINQAFVQSPYISAQ